MQYGTSTVSKSKSQRLKVKARATKDKSLHFRWPLTFYSLVETRPRTDSRGETRGLRWAHRCDITVSLRSAVITGAASIVPQQPNPKAPITPSPIKDERHVCTRYHSAQAREILHDAIGYISLIGVGDTTLGDTAQNLSTCVAWRARGLARVMRPPYWSCRRPQRPLELFSQSPPAARMRRHRSPRMPGRS